MKAYIIAVYSRGAILEGFTISAALFIAVSPKNAKAEIPSALYKFNGSKIRKSNY